MSEPLLSDQQLIEAAQRGDRVAFRKLFEAHSGQVTRLLCRLIPRADVEDVGQEVFLHVHRSLGTFRGDARFTTWLYRLTLNIARMHLRKQRSRPSLTLTPDEEGGPLERSESETPLSLSERGERLEALSRLLDRLSEKKREALVLHDFQGLSAEEIADVVEAPVMTVRTRLFYARKELYAALSEEEALAGIERSVGTLPGRPAPRPEATLTPSKGRTP
jgi:RNA polymerase sigma-70 factor, ECF subfamily